MTINQDYDVIIIGSGMGGLSTAALLANDGYKVLVLEKGLHPGGCSSSYPRKKFVFEAGATTLMGFDKHQPLWFLENKTGLNIPRVEINPSMSVILDGEAITRFKNRDKWIAEAARVFGNEAGQRAFWNFTFKVSDRVWELSLKNRFFPPQSMREWANLLAGNNPADIWLLRYAAISVKKVAKKFKVDTPKFIRFLDEQLLITTQANTDETPFIYGAPGLTYTNYSNFYVPGGLIVMANAICDFIKASGGKVHTKEGVVNLERKDGNFILNTKKAKSYQAPIVISNVPVWNMPDITNGEMKFYFAKESAKYEQAWGALTMGIGTTDTYPDELGIHHQIHLPDKQAVPYTNSKSIFVSMSQQGDEKRAKSKTRALNISTHADPDVWFAMGEDYESNKEEVQEFILDTLRKQLPGFAEAEIKVADLATPVSWESWVSRKKGRVGGLPQSMARGLLSWTPNQTPFKGLYLVGDTTYPGQGIPGVTLSGISVYSRVKKII